MKTTFRLRSLTGLALMTVWIADSSIVHAQNLVTNGSFENLSGTYSPSGDYMRLLPGATNIPGWTVTNDQFAWLESPNVFGLTTPYGSYFLDLTGDNDSVPHGGVTQIIATTPLQDYTLALSLGAHLDVAAYAGEKSVLVTAGASSASFTFAPTGTGNQWGAFSFSFLATNASTPITIIGLSAGTGFAYVGLDNVSVTASVAASPQLRITLAAPFVATLSWSTNATNHFLESATALPAPSWDVITNIPTIANGQFNVSVSATNDHQFFRLHQQ